MLSEIFQTIKTIKPFFLLVIFLALSIFVYSEEETKLFSNPLSFWALTIPVVILIGFGLALGWVSLVTRLKFLLPKEDLADYSVLLACSMLTYCLIITFSFLANNPNQFSTQLLIQPEFIYTCTLYIATLVTFDIAGS